MNTPKSESMRFIENAMQGLAFWIGYSRSYYRNYRLSEAALISELCSLIQAQIPNNLKLYPEVMYTRLIKSKSNYLSDKSRADLVILDGDHLDPYKNDVSKNIKYIFEVKRSGVSVEDINHDLRRLFDFKKLCKTNARAFLIIASEANIPHEFFNVDTGKSQDKEFKIPETNGVYRVRRTTKASASFEKTEMAHYVSICEVFEKPQKTVPKF